jgi:hypothetical protein
MLAHNTAVMAGVASIESKLDNIFDDTNLSDQFTSLEQLVKQEAVDVQQDVGDVKLQVIEAHTHIEALIGQPSDIPSINRRRKRDGKRMISIL